MILKCLGTEAFPHEEVRWLGTNAIDAHCWFCLLEGLDTVYSKPASEASIVFRKVDLSVR